MNRLSNKTAIITGGANGIGKAIAEAFSEEGAFVVIADLDVDAGTAAVETIIHKGAEALFVAVDVSSEKDALRVVELAAARTGRIDVLCNNAAYMGKTHAIIESTQHEWDRCIQVTLLGTHNFTKAVLPYMIRQQRGSIINIASIQAMVGCPDSAAYTATKSAILGYTSSAAYDYGRNNVRVNSISPGPIQTRISPKPGSPFYKWQQDQTMLGRVGQVEEIAHAAVFLASDEASFITGINLPVDGGWTAK